MRGCLKKRSKKSWTIILDKYVTDPKTGAKKRKRQFITVEGNKQKAEERLGELLHKKQTGEFVNPSKITFGRWLTHWVETAIKPARRIRTYEGYKSIIDRHLTPELGEIRLQELDSTDLDRYYAKKAAGDKEKKQRALSQTSLEHHHVIISSSLKAAMKKRFLEKNVAQLVAYRPQAPDNQDDAREQAWTVQEARKFLETAKTFGPQSAAFYALALDSGMRKGELCGLGWEHFDPEKGTIGVQRSLVKPGNPPLFGPTKSGKARVIRLSGETVTLLKVHRKHQAEVKMKNRATYNDLGLVFAKEWEDVRKHGDTLGDPLQSNNLGQREYAAIIKASKVKTIKFHGMRHTCATLLLQAGVPPKVVQERLGHKGIEITMNIYAHVLPDMQEQAADTMGNILHG